MSLKYKIEKWELLFVLLLPHILTVLSFVFPQIKLDFFIVVIRVVFLSIVFWVSSKSRIKYIYPLFIAAPLYVYYLWSISFSQMINIMTRSILIYSYTFFFGSMIIKFIISFIIKKIYCLFHYFLQKKRS